jgi:hypothetical protein
VFVLGETFPSLCNVISSLVGPFVGYDENEVLGMKPQHLNFFENYDWTDKARAFFRVKTFELCVM